MQLNPEDVYPLSSLPCDVDVVLFVYENELVVPARLRDKGWEDIRTNAPPLGEPIGWTHHGEPLIDPTGAYSGSGRARKRGRRRLS